MPLMPKRVKYRKCQRGSRAGLARKCNKLDFGDFGLQALDRAWISNNQIEADEVLIRRCILELGSVPHGELDKTCRQENYPRKCH